MRPGVRERRYALDLLLQASDVMGILTPELTDFLDGEPVGVLATSSSRGRPRQSLVYFARDGDRLLISTLSYRLKARELQDARRALRQPRRKVSADRRGCPSRATRS